MQEAYIRMQEEFVKEQRYQSPDIGPMLQYCKAANPKYKSNDRDREKSGKRLM